MLRCDILYTEVQIPVLFLKFCLFSRVMINPLRTTFLANVFSFFFFSKCAYSGQKRLTLQSAVGERNRRKKKKNACFVINHSWNVLHYQQQPIKRSWHLSSLWLPETASVYRKMKPV